MGLYSYYYPPVPPLHLAVESSTNPFDAPVQRLILPTHCELRIVAALRTRSIRSDCE